VIRLRIIHRASLVKPTTIEDLIDESIQLAKIITASVKTVRTRTAIDK